MVASTVTRIGVVTAVATPIWFSAAMMPSPVTNQAASAASIGP